VTAVPAELLAAPTLVPSVYADVVIWRFVGVRPDGRLAVRFTTALRRAIMSRVEDPLPEALHGHGVPGRPHVAFLALPWVGDQHADGHLLGLAVAVPHLDAADRDRVHRGLLKRRTEHAFPLRVPGIGCVYLRYEPGIIGPAALDPRRWRRGSRHWASATPVVLDRHPHRGDVAAEVEHSLRTAGLPTHTTITAIDVSTHPLQPAALRLRPDDLPRYARGRPYRHVAVTFDEPVAGPILAGATRHLGIGLLTPTPTTPVRPLPPGPHLRQHPPPEPNQVRCKR
jgi:CRISPR-associated protein Csb2